MRQVVRIISLREDDAFQLSKYGKIDPKGYMLITNEGNWHNWFDCPDNRMTFTGVRNIYFLDGFEVRTSYVLHPNCP